MTVESVNYKRESDFLAACIIEFDEDQENSDRIFKNLIRTYDVESIEIVSCEKAAISANGKSL